MFEIGDRVSRADGFSPVGIVRNIIRVSPPRWQENGVEHVSYNVYFPTINYQANINEENWKRFEFIEGDISDFNTCLQVTRNVDYVLHQAAMGSVPRSIEDPLTTNRSNIDGFINMLLAAKESEVKSFVYAASSSTYGDHPALPKKEENIGTPLSPYAVTCLLYTSPSPRD